MRRTTILTILLATSLCLPAINAFGQAQAANTPHRFRLRSAPAINHGSQSAEELRRSVVNGASSATNTLPLWNYEVASPRDGNLYEGIIVGHDPSVRGSGASASVTTQLVPIVLRFHRIATSFNPNTGRLSTRSGIATSDPTKADPGCFAGSANVPLQLMAQSPIFRNADFNFGGTDVGTTQYVDAFQRGNFWKTIDKANYHVRLAPVQIYAPVVVDVPASKGILIPPSVFAAYFPMCGAESLVDINFFDAIAVNETTKLPGINPGTFPMFMLYNSSLSFGDPADLNNCCAGGYHGINPEGLKFQTYSPFDFDVSGFFFPSDNDTATASHEVAEWMNDPYVVNATPAWGHTGQVANCQNNYEVGDPLSGTEAPRVVMPNGYTYHLQELAFFSWFFGDPSLGIHGWDSNNGTFLTDAGPVCQ